MVLSLGEAPEESSREDAISEGISIARELARARKKSPKPRKSDSDKPQATMADKVIEPKPEAVDSEPVVHELVVPPSPEKKSFVEMASAQDESQEEHQDASEAPESTSPDSNEDDQSADVVSETVTVPASENETGPSSSSDDVELVVSHEVVTDLMDEEDVEVLGELTRMNDDRLKALDEDSEDDSASDNERDEDSSESLDDSEISEDSEENFEDSIDALPDDEDDLPDVEHSPSDEDEDFDIDEDELEGFIKNLETDKD